MTQIRPFLILGLVAVLSAACGPTAAPTNPPAVIRETSVLVPTATQPPAGEATVLPIATSRGPNLEATDPATVSLASGGLQFVEFFRFT